MISSISITDPNDLPVKWWSKNKTLLALKEINLTPGLNILWGKNGSGKSSVLKLLAQMFHAEQSRYSTVTTHSMSELFKFSPNKKERLPGIKIMHDGQGIAYFNPTHKVGLIGGLAGFDDDFFEAGLKSIFTHGSSGQLVTHEVNQIFLKLKDKKTINVNFKAKREFLTSIWKNRVGLIDEFFKPNIEPGKPTIVLDEPDRSMDLPNQADMWRVFPKFTKMYQLIVATHSPFAVNIKDANYIELTSGYLEKCRQVLGGIFYG